MGKTMAQLEDNIVVNMIWCSDAQIETDELKNVNDRPVGIGDTYENNKFYRNGIEVLTMLEQAYLDLNNLQEEINTMIIDYEYQLAVLSPASMAIDNEQKGNIRLYNALSRMIDKKQIEDIENKLIIFFASGKITEAWYNELLENLNKIPKN